MELTVIYGIILLMVVAIARLAQLSGIEIAKEYRESYLTAQRGQMADLFVAVDPGRILTASIVLGLLLAIIVYVAMGSLVISVPLLLAVPLAFTLSARIIRRRRLNRFEQQFPDALAMLNANMRAGVSLANALQNVARQCQPPMSQELGMLEKELQVGKTDEAYRNLAKRIPMPSVSLFVTAVLTCNRLGGNLTEMTDKIAVTIRRNIQLRQELKTLTAEGRTQGLLMGLMPFIVGGVLTLIDPEMMRPLYTTTIGNLIIVVVIFLDLLGLIIIREILKIED